MLRLPPFRYHRPRTVNDAVGLLNRWGARALPVSGGTDLIPNMKHRLFTPEHLVALKQIPEMRGFKREGSTFVIGGAETLASVARHPQVRRRFPSLAAAAGQVAGPQLRNMGTLGGNICLDTRCTYYNQTEFWRSALGYCLKKGGDACHVTRVGKKCVAAHSADTPPVLMTLGASVELAGPDGRRHVSLNDFFLADGIWNSRRKPGEIVTRVRIPFPSRDSRAAYAKLRQRRSIDFPLLSVAVSADFQRSGRVCQIMGVVSALGARPRLLTGWARIATGQMLSDEVIEALAERAHHQCHPLENTIVDPDWRRAMVPVQVRLALEALRDKDQP
jgi:4-hydroxybenzoyl-CoA reductase subunit beta